jgi:hypothetical protein
MTQLSRPGRTTPCSWPVSYSACSGAADAIPDCDDRALFEQMAATHLWEWTDRRYGLCEVTVRPCRRGCVDGALPWGNGWHPPTTGGFGSGGGLGGWYPVLIGGTFFNLTDGCGGDQCSCGTVSRLQLPGPVTSVSSVQIDGTTLASSAYRVDGNGLVRTDGESWPVCQHLSLELGEVGTWGVTYEHGLAVPEGGQVAAGLLAVEFYKAACGDTSCKLPARVSSVARQGVTLSLMPAIEGSVEKGYSGLFLVDSWIASVTKPKQVSTVLSPDYGRRGRR